MFIHAEVWAMFSLTLLLIAMILLVAAPAPKQTALGPVAYHPAYLVSVYFLGIVTLIMYAGFFGMLLWHINPIAWLVRL